MTSKEKRADLRQRKTDTRKLKDKLKEIRQTALVSLGVVTKRREISLGAAS